MTNPNDDFRTYFRNLIAKAKTKGTPLGKLEVKVHEAALIGKTTGNWEPLASAFTEFLLFEARSTNNRPSAS
tara:strand:- start:15899 stop:16114 length:216 start_codon:yes stop_codon:yes gene_type:complete